jgi:hypothetical protein
MSLLNLFWRNPEWVRFSKMPFIASSAPLQESWRQGPHESMPFEKAGAIGLGCTSVLINSFFHFGVTSVD